jgi:glycosyltransferase involved in cell wall biosynthesis
MRIVYLINRLDIHGGIEKILSLKVNSLIREYGYEITIITTSHKKGTPFLYPLEKNVEHIDLDLRYLTDKSLFHPANILVIIKHYFKLKEKVRLLNPSIIISSGFSPEQYFLPFVFKSIPKIKELHFSGFILKGQKFSLSKVFYNFLNKVYKKYDALVLLNKDEINYFPFKNVQVIPNFIPIDFDGIDFKRQKIIVAAGRIADVKQFDHLIKAWGFIADQFQDWEVRIYGNGDTKLFKSLESLIVDMEIPRISLMGDTSLLQEELFRSSVYAMTSKNECFPMVLLEAQMAGLPVVSYNCPTGPGNIIENEISGFLVEPQNIIEFSNKLKSLIEDELLRIEMGINARKNVNKYSTSEIIKKWNDLFLELV